MHPYQYWMVTILCVVMVIGIPGNVLVFSVYFVKSRKNSTHVLIMSTAVLDIAICFWSIARIFHWIYESSYEANYKCRGYQVLGSWSEFFSAYMTTAIAVDRYFQICRPHSHTTPKKALASSFVGLSVSLIFSIPVAFLYGVMEGNCKITRDGIALYLPLGLAFGAFAFLMVTALVLYLLVYLEVRKRFNNRSGSVIFLKTAPSTLTDSVKRTEVHSLDVKKEQTFKVKCKDSISVETSSDNTSKTENEGDVLGNTAKQSPLESDKSVGIRTGTGMGTETELQMSQVKINDSVKDASSENQIRKTDITPSEENRVDDGYKALMAQMLHSDKDKGSGGEKPNNYGSHLQMRPVSRTAGVGSRSGRTGRMLLLATVVFVVTWTARCIMWLITNIEDDWWKQLRLDDMNAYAFLTLVQHIYYTTPAMNPIIYSFANPRFRGDSAEILRWFKCCCKNKVFPG
ncbi:Vasopressin V1b receptor [Holothuria leucospilota]|uniref:Vasopressin V1b receptor n=1 Tax=Holothuria leucospilota TaxID=206669 RepID=A0A9Q1BE22_HOLLE|nr:Vasopressin V1b receptor [Holothuria leucospilota]